MTSSNTTPGAMRDADQAAARPRGLTPRHPGHPSRTAGRRHLARIALAACAGLAVAISGCANQLPDGFFDPTKPSFVETPIAVPILERLVAIEGPAGMGFTDPSPVRPEDLVPEVEAYRVTPGDRLEVRIQEFIREGEPAILDVVVDPRGFIILPQLDPVYVAGLSVEDVRAGIVQAVADKGILTNAVVAVQALERRGLTYFISGDVQTPSQYPIPRPDFRLLDALTLSGRFGEGTEYVYVIRQIPLDPRLMRGSFQPPAAAPGAPALPTSSPGTVPSPSTPPSPASPPRPGESVIDVIDSLTRPPGEAPVKPDPNQPRGGSTPGSTPPGSTGGGAPKLSGLNWSRSATPFAANFAANAAVLQPPANTPPPPPIDLPDPDRGKPVDLPKPATGAEPANPSTPTRSATPTPAASPAKAPTSTAPASAQPGAGSGGRTETVWQVVDGKWVKVTRVKPPPMLPPGPLPRTPVAEPVLPTVPTLQPAAPRSIPQPPPLPDEPERPINLPPIPVQQAAPVAGAEKLVTERVIQVPLRALLSGAAQFNIVIRPGDHIRVPPAPQGLVYVTGEVARPGTYNFPPTGKLTLSRAVIAAGDLGSLAIPERVSLTRMVGPDRQAMIRLNLAAIRRGTQPDVFLKPDDVVTIGTNFWALPLAVFRQGFRFSYGFGFVLDRNFQGEVFGLDRSQSR